MDPREVVDAYLQGRIESWGVFRKLVRMGLSTATALAVAGALPAAVKAQSVDVLGQIEPTAEELSILDLLVSHLAVQLEKVEAGGAISPLAATLARIGGNNANLFNCGNNNDNLISDNPQQCDAIKLTLNDGFNNLTGELVPGNGNLMLNLNGSIGQSNVNLLGMFNHPNAENNDPNENHNLSIGQVNMNVVGNIGSTNLHLTGSLGNLDTTPIGDNPGNNNGGNNDR